MERMGDFTLPLTSEELSGVAGCAHQFWTPPAGSKAAFSDVSTHQSLFAVVPSPDSFGRCSGSLLAGSH